MAWFQEFIEDVETAWRVFRVLRKSPFGAIISVTQTGQTKE